jgi:glutamate/tyrosine decarboxylase-like PLP-dependent enzyme
MGSSKETIMDNLEQYAKNDIDWRSGRVFAYVYHAGPEAEALCKAAYMRFLTENALDPTVFPSLLRLENEVVSMVTNRLGGNENSRGSVTSGGTESIILAVKTARDAFQAAHPTIDTPEVVLPETAHASFKKAGHLLKMKVISVPVDPATYKADPHAMEAAIGPRCAMLVASAPSYAHGVVDPISELGEIALKHRLFFHVDACIGGMVLPYFAELGEPVPPFDLSVPGVTSLSVDLHKYGFSAKGASVLLHKEKEHRAHQIFACATWSGYTVINNTIQSSRSGGPLAAAWAMLQYFGESGYRKLCEKMLQARKQLVSGISKIEGLNILGDPQSTLIAFASQDNDVFHIADEMSARGWYIQPQLAYGCSPPSVHLSLNPSSLEFTEQFLSDLTSANAAAKSLPRGQMVQLLESGGIELDALDNEKMGALMKGMGINGVDLPERMAHIHELLNALPTSTREDILVQFMNDLYGMTQSND